MANQLFQNIGKSLIALAPASGLAGNDRAGSGALSDKHETYWRDCMLLQSHTERGAMSKGQPACRPMRFDFGRWHRTIEAPRVSALAGLLAVFAIATGTAPPTMLPTANAAPGQHTVVYRILGGGDVFSVIPDPGTPVYPKSTTTWVSTPWSQTVQVTGNPYLALNYTDKNGGPHDCAIQVDGQPVALTEHTTGRCAYQIPGPAG
jgi:hypothetical protein